MEREAFNLQTGISVCPRLKLLDGASPIKIKFKLHTNVKAMHLLTG